MNEERIKEIAGSIKWVHSSECVYEAFVGDTSVGVLEKDYELGWTVDVTGYQGIKEIDDPRYCFSDVDDAKKEFVDQFEEHLEVMIIALQAVGYNEGLEGK